MVAYTYLVIHKTLANGIMGVRYAKGCEPSDLFVKYFTSSKTIKKIIESEGHTAFKFEIRKTFESIDKARIWEHKVLRRMNAVNNEQSFNLSDAVSIPAPSPELMRGDRNIIHRKEVKFKTVCSKIKSNIIKLIKTLDDPKHIAKKNIKRFKKYIKFIELNNPFCKRILFKLTHLLNKCQQIEKKPYPNNRKSQKRGKMPKISESKLGLKSYKNILTGEIKRFKDNPGDNWVPGLHSDESKQKIREASLGREYSVEFREKMRDIRRGSMYFTSPDLTEYKQFDNIDNVPAGWIRGIKVKSRNDKISKYLSEIRYNENSKN